MFDLKFLFNFWIFSKAFFLTPLATIFLSPGMMNLPKPTGPHVVGTTAFKVVDQSRMNAPFSDELRKFNIYCWYPATQETNHTLPYLAHNAKPLKREFYKGTHLPTAVIDSIFSVRTHGFVHAPPKTQVAPYPVIVISHGLGGFGLLHCALAENLASRGYFVVGVDHTHFSTVSVIDGEHIWYDKIIHDLFDSNPPLPRAEVLKKSAQLFQIPVADIRETINFLERLNTDANQQWFEQLDLSRLGIVGHSMGGISGLEVARTDTRCKAVVSLDGWLPGMNTVNAIGKPAMILFSDATKLDVFRETEFLQKRPAEELKLHYKQLTQQAQQFVSNNGKDSFFTTIPGASHLSFCDFILLRWPLTTVIPARQAGFFSGQNPYPIVQRINTLVRKFFDRYVKK